MGRPANPVYFVNAIKINHRWFGERQKFFSVRLASLDGWRQLSEGKELFRNKKALLFGFVTWTVLMVGTFVFDQYSIDSCLDSGGSYDYSVFRCDITENHYTIPYLQARFGRFVGLTVSFAVWSLFALMPGIFSSKKEKEKL